MDDGAVSTSVLLGELADAYDRCSLTMGNLAQLLSQRVSVAPEDECSTLESATPQNLYFEASPADLSSPSGPAASVPSAVPPALFRSRSSAERRQLLNMARCDLPQIVNPRAGLRPSVIDTDLLQPSSSAGPGSPASPLSAVAPFASFRRTSTDLTPSRRMSWANAQPPPLQQPQPPPPQLMPTPPPILIRGRSLQRYDSNPGISEDELATSSPLGGEPLAYSPRFSGGAAGAWGMSPKLSAGGAGGAGGSGGGAGSLQARGSGGSTSGRFLRSQSSALPSSPTQLLQTSLSAADPSIGGMTTNAAGASGGGGGGGGGGVALAARSPAVSTSGGTPLVPTPPPLSSRVGLSAKTMLFFRSRRSLAVAEAGVAPLSTDSGGGGGGTPAANAGGGIGGGGGGGSPLTSSLSPGPSPGYGLGGAGRRPSRSMSTSGVLAAARSATGAQLQMMSLQQQQQQQPQLLPWSQDVQDDTPAAVSEPLLQYVTPSLLGAAAAAPPWPGAAAAAAVGAASAAPPPRRSLQGLPPRSSSSRFSTSDWGLPTD